MNTRLTIVCKGIKIKLDRGEDLEEILATYVNLTDQEKNIIRDHFNN